MHFARREKIQEARTDEVDEKARERRIWVAGLFNFDKIFIPTILSWRLRGGCSTSRRRGSRVRFGVDAEDPWAFSTDGRCDPPRYESREKGVGGIESANSREILLPFFRQCIWGGGAPSAVQ